MSVTMLPKTSITPRATATLVLGLLLSLSVAVLGSAFSPSTTPNNSNKIKQFHRQQKQSSLVLPSSRWKQQQHLSKLYTKNNSDDEEEAAAAAADAEALLAEDALRGGGTATLPAALPAMPTLRDFRKFAIPCLALWVSGPLLSLVDTSFVGLSGSAADSAKQLAALGPATTFFDGATYLFAFLNVATTNLYSSALARSGGNSDEAESVVRTAARVSRNCGIGLMIFLFVACRPLLKLYIGTWELHISLFDIYIYIYIYSHFLKWFSLAL